MRFAPGSEAKKLFGIPGEESEELEGHFGENIPVGFVVRIEEDYGRTIAFGEDIVIDLVVGGGSGASSIGAGDGEDP